MVAAPVAAGTVEDFELGAGDLALEFANTADWHAGPAPVEFLKSYADLVAWSQRCRVVDAAERKGLVLQSKRRPGEARAVLKRAIDLREAIYRTFSAIAHQKAPRNQDMTELNLALAGSLSRLRVVSEGKQFSWEWSGGQTLDRMIGPIAQAAASLLTSPDLSRVGECADDRGCGWLFVDRSKNHSRRWCDMNGCGNRAKANRHQQRAREA
ncbi:MAG: ABATE domain-containing protein [Anaerolineales bacterium]